MNDDLKYDTYMFISYKKFIICVIDKQNLNLIYKVEKIIENYFNKLDFEKLNDFLEGNIFKIEKNLKCFVKNVYLILDTNDFLTAEMSIKSNNIGNKINLKSLYYPLSDAKDQFQKSLDDKKIIHMFIENYNINNNNYSKLPKNLECESFSLSIKFICLSNEISFEIEKILKKYQILINQWLSLKYVEKFYDENNSNIFQTACKVVAGYNTNEVVLVNKTAKNKGFFEKFFNFFS